MEPENSVGDQGKIGFWGFFGAQSLGRRLQLHKASSHTYTLCQHHNSISTASFLKTCVTHQITLSHSMHSNTLHAQARSVTLKHCNPYPCAVAPNAAAHRAQTRGLASRSAAARPQQRRTESTGHKQLAAALPRSQVEAVIPPTQQQQQQQPANAR